MRLLLLWRRYIFVPPFFCYGGGSYGPVLRQKTNLTILVYFIHFVFHILSAMFFFSFKTLRLSFIMRVDIARVSVSILFFIFAA